MGVVQDRLIRKIRDKRRGTRHDVDDDSTNASAESMRELKHTQESKKRRGKTHC